MEFIAREDRNPFDMQPACDRFVPGYGDTSADFHVIGDNPSVHGGLSTGIPFTDCPWSEQFFDALYGGELLQQVDLPDGRLLSKNTYLSYLHMCDPGEEPPDAHDYSLMEPFFDAELRAITAHVLFPVGARATKHVLSNYSARAVEEPLDMDSLHGTEIHGSGWLVIPIKEPAEWANGDSDHLVDALITLQQKDYRQISDLGRFLADDESHMVR